MKSRPWSAFTRIPGGFADGHADLPNKYRWINGGCHDWDDGSGNGKTHCCKPTLARSHSRAGADRYRLRYDLLRGHRPSAPRLGANPSTYDTNGVWIPVGSAIRSELQHPWSHHWFRAASGSAAAR